MRYIQPPWENYFFSKVQSVEKSLYLSSPYIKNAIATLFYKVLRSKQDLNLSIQILTSVGIQDLREGASDLEAFEKLLQLEELEGINAEVRCIPNLHAKVYIFDEDSAIVTSSNLTPSGLKSNIEYGIEVTDPTAIQSILVDMGNYWDDAEILTTETLEQVRERLETTENVDRAAQKRKNRSSIGNSSTSVQSIGKRIAPLGQDLENAELDNLRGTILKSTSPVNLRPDEITGGPSPVPTLPIQKPDDRIKGQMVLVNWLKHRMDLTYDEIRDILGLAKSGTTVQVYHRFDFQRNGSVWEKPVVPPEWFLWNWQNEAREYLSKRRLQRGADTTEIDSWIQALSKPASRISLQEATEWAEEINDARR